MASICAFISVGLSSLVTKLSRVPFVPVSLPDLSFFLPAATSWLPLKSENEGKSFVASYFPNFLNVRSYLIDM